MQCDHIAEIAPQIVDGNGTVDPEFYDHIKSCLRCQAELAKYRKLLRGLHQLRTEVLEPAPGLLAEILAGLEAAGERQAIRSLVTKRRAAYAGGIAVATAAGVAGIVVLAGRSRQRTEAKGRRRDRSGGRTQRFRRQQHREKESLAS